jgi:iron complex transport system ATP-binding protein
MNAAGHDHEHPSTDPLAGPPALSLHDLRFRYERDAPFVLQGLSLQVQPGTITAILGPNGSGKTTLLHILLGRLKPLEGVVLLQGQPLDRLSRRDLSRAIALVAQEEDVSFEYAVLEYVILGRAPYLGWLDAPKPADYAEAETAIRQAGVAHLQWRSMPSLSGGERQLARLARALAQRPRILLLDEPTNHLDLSNQGRVLHMMRVLAAQGVAVIFTTHDATAAASVAQAVILVRKGQTLAAGPTADVMTDANLTLLYQTPVRVRQVEGRLVVLAD